MDTVNTVENQRRPTREVAWKWGDDDDILRVFCKVFLPGVFVECLNSIINNDGFVLSWLRLH